MERIKRLSDSVINRIAAGEVVQRPSAALKELLENALDAGSTSIQVLVHDGGLGVLQVTDDGHGIHTDDLPLLCERYATSKLRSFEDLSHITSFGFRGEALSSISYVSRVIVTTMRRACSDGASSSRALAWRCQYVDGMMQGEPTPCAGNPGTSIRVEKMFYNSAVRRRALSRPSEEYSRIVTVVSRYALAFPHVAFSCRREETASGKSEVFFPKDSTTLANIRLFHGPSVASHLHEFRCVGAGAGSCTPEAVLEKRGSAGENCFLINGYTSGIALLNRKSYLCVFVNNRLVESIVIKRALDTVYSGILTGGNRPFTVLFITIPPDRVDVNIHPTKHEVCLLDEEIIVGQLSENVRLAVMESAARHQLDTRPILSKAVGLSDRGARLSHSSSSSLLLNGVTAAPCTIVRVEPQRGALDAYCQHMSTLPKEGTEMAARDNVGNKHGRTSCNNTDTSIAVKLEESVPKKEKHVVETTNVSTAPSEDASLSLATSLVNIGSTTGKDDDDDGGGGRVCLKLKEKEEDEDAEDEDLGYVMQQFKRSRKEIQKAVGVMSTADDEVKEEAEKEEGKEKKGENKGVNGSHIAPGFVLEESAPEVVPDDREDLLLTSVSTIVAHIHQVSSPTAQSLFEKLSFVGVLNAHIFLAQSGTTLYAVDTLRLVRLVVYQRIFLRWAMASLPAPPQLLLEEPLKVSDLLCFALQHDVEPKPDNYSVDSIQCRVRRLDRCLRQWRHMLLEYFAVDISQDGYLMALPFGLNTSWPPAPRVVPLFLWRLAAEVPYGEDELGCFTSIARHIADTLYGLRLHDAWAGRHVTPSPTSSNPTGGGGGGGKGDGALPSLVDAIRFALVPCAISLKFFIPPADSLIDGTLQTVVSVEELYKVFERC